MRTSVLLACASACLLAAGIAIAAQPAPSTLSVKASATSSKGVGSKTRPVAVSVGYAVSTSTADGSRQETWATLDNAWGGVVNRGGLFPTCTADEIDAAQSDAKCPKGSLVGTGSLDALVGPENDFSSPGIKCSKSVRVYNAGQGKIALLLVGPASACAGVGYLSPFRGTWTKKGGVDGGENLVLPIPSNISHPLPGILGSTVRTVVTFKKLTATSKGVKHGYVESIACRGKRAFSQHIVGDPSGKVYDSKATAGGC